MSHDQRQIESSCNLILRNVRSSGLNFSAQETPFSLYLTIRKSQIISKYSLQPQHQSPSAAITSVNQTRKSEADLDSIRKCYDVLSVKHKHLEEAFDKVKGYYEEATNDCLEKDNLLEQFELKVEGLSDENNELKNKLEDALKVQESAQIEVKHLKEATKKVIDESTSAKDELKVVKRENSKQTRELKELKKVLEDCKAVRNELEKEICALNLGKLQVKTVTTQTEPKPFEKHLYSDLKRRVKDDSNNNPYESDSNLEIVRDKEHTTEPSPGSTLECCHIPQCYLRDPQPPPPFLPLNWVEHSEYYEPRPPPNIRLLPNEVENVEIFHSLSTKHQCEECDSGSMFENHHELVYYPDPGPCGGTSGSQIKTCPNNPNATNIKVLAISQPRVPYWKQHKSKKRFRCNICDRRFEKMSNLTFHVNRKRSKATWAN